MAILNNIPGQIFSQEKHISIVHAILFHMV